MRKQLGEEQFCESVAKDSQLYTEPHEILEAITQYLKENGADKNFMVNWGLYIMDPRFTRTTLITRVGDFLTEKEKRDYSDKCVFPYIEAHDQYGYADSGLGELIGNFYWCFTDKNWETLMTRVLEEIYKGEPAYLYSANRDLELMNLYYNMARHPGKIEKLFEERLSMHWNWITENGILNLKEYILDFDQSIHSLQDFVCKQIGK